MQAAKAALHVSLEKSEFITNVTGASKKMILEIGKINKSLEKFESNLTEKTAFPVRINKVELAHRLT